MPLTTLATVTGLIGAGLFAWSFRGALGAGAVAGFLAGAALSGWGVWRQRRAIAVDPRRALRVLVENFLAKLGALVCAALFLGFVPLLKQTFDWRAFLVAFGLASLVVLLPGTIENARYLKLRHLEPRSLEPGAAE